MKKLLPKFALACSLVLLAAASTTAVPYSFRIQAKIPFDFQIGSKKFPKGEYTIETVGSSNLLLIRNLKGKKSTNFAVIPDKMTEKPKSKLSFRRYGEQYFLRKIWDGQNTSFVLEKSSAEKKVAKLLKGKEEDEGDEVPLGDKPDKQ
jgi:hypothetical protein